LAPAHAAGASVPTMAASSGSGRSRGVARSGATQPTGRDERRALAQLGLAEVGRAIGGIAGMHRAIADRAFRASGPGAAPAHALHDAISAGVYGALRGATDLAGRGAGAALAERRGAVGGGAPAVDRIGVGRPAAGRGRAPSESAGGAAGLAILNGLIGDQLEREGSDLCQPLAVRVDGCAVEPTRPALARAFPAAHPRLVVFLHGLMETEFAWRSGGREPYSARLERDLGVSAIDVRYNTGRHISENGRALADLLERLVAAWPVEVEQIALIGHSMGGLVARSACHIATADGPSSAAWVARVRHVISLGSPHLGAPLAQGVHCAAAALDAVPETRSLGGFLRRRSAGIRDLRHGSLVDADWRDQDPDALRARAYAEVPLLPGATHCFVAATISASPRHPLGLVLGDALVLVPSASGRGRTRRIGFRDEDGMHLGGAHHLALLNHPTVYAQLHDWLSPPVVCPAP
jgi:pimeloyl-ACP methyl ester carboxylesterase